MPEFLCRCGTPTGEIVERTYTANDAVSLRRELESQDLLVLGIQRRSAVAAAAGELFSKKKKLNIGEFLFFNQQFAALIRAGLPITEALNLLIERRENPELKTVLEDVRARVRTGESLSEAFGAQDGVPGIYSSTLASGERSGEVDSVLRRYIAYAKTISGVKRKVVGAMVYPAVLLTILVIIIAILLIVVLPKFQSFFADMGAELPLITSLLLDLSDLLRTQWYWIIAGVAGVFFGIALWRRTPAGRRLLERVFYGFPVVGSIARKFVYTRFSRTLSTLVAGGIPLVTCLEIVARAVETPLFRDAVEGVAAKVREGAALWEMLDETELFPGMMVEMIKVGESSGALAEMLEHVADFNDEEIDHELQRAVSLVEPIMLVLMAVVVGGMLLAIYYPMLVAYANSSAL